MLDDYVEHDVRTTLAIDDDVLLAAKAIAQQRNRPVGEVISELARKSLNQPALPPRWTSGHIGNGECAA